MSLQITPILGIIEIGQGGELLSAKPAGNSTRWIFDVDGVLENELVVQLVEMRTKRLVVTDLVACSFLPRSPSFYDARPYMAEQVGGLITIRHSGIIPMEVPDSDKFVKAVACSYRVMIDVLHTSTR